MVFPSGVLKKTSETTVNRGFFVLEDGLSPSAFDLKHPPSSIY